MRKTFTLVQIAAELLTAPDDSHWGYDIATRTGIPSGVVYPVLTRLCDAGWLTSTWDEPPRRPSTKTRPARRNYTLTDEGKTRLTTLLDEARTDSRFTRWLQ